jgi:hypothetical protein
VNPLTTSLQQDLWVFHHCRNTSNLAPAFAYLLANRGPSKVILPMGLPAFAAICVDIIFMGEVEDEEEMAHLESKVNSNRAYLPLVPNAPDAVSVGRLCRSNNGICKERSRRGASVPQTCFRCCNIASHINTNGENTRKLRIES